MALLTMNQQPETRLMDTFQIGKDKNRFGGGTSLPLNSDGYEEKQMRLRDERHQEWLIQQQQRGIHQQPSNVPINQLDYEENRKVLNAERKREYMQYMDKKAKEERSLQNQGRSFTPVGGLNIGNYDRQLKEQAAQKKKEYKEMLDQQKREQLYLRARQQPEISVIERNVQSQYLANKPPSGPAYRPRDEPPPGQGYRPRDEPPLGQGYRLRAESPLGQGHRPRDEPFLGQGYRPRDEPSLGQGYRPRDEPSLGQGYRPRDEPSLGQGYRPRDEPSLGQGYRPRDEPSLGQGYRPRDEPQPELGYRPRDEAFMSDPLPDRSSRGQKPLPGDSQGQIMNGGERASRSPHPPKSPERLYQPDWLIGNEPVKLSETGTPLAFKTDLPQVAPPKEKISNGPLFKNEKLFLFEKSGTPRSRGSFKEREQERVLSKPEKRTRKKETEEEQIYHVSLDRAKDASYRHSVDVGAARKDADIMRQNEYDEYLKLKAEEQQRKEDTKQQLLAKPTEIVKSPHYSSENYEIYQRELQKKQGDDYREFLTKKSLERPPPHKDWNFDQKGSLELRGDDAVQSKQRELRAERQQDYQNYISQQRAMNPSRHHEFVDTAAGPYNGLFQGLGEHGNVTDTLNQQRKQEYNDQLSQKGGAAYGRTSFARDAFTNNADAAHSLRNLPAGDNYQQILDEKRREEANRRRYDDPEYQERLVQADNSTARYGY